MKSCEKDVREKKNIANRLVNRKKNVRRQPKNKKGGGGTKDFRVTNLRGVVQMLKGDTTRRAEGTIKLETCRSHFLDFTFAGFKREAQKKNPEYNRLK